MLGEALPLIGIATTPQPRQKRISETPMQAVIVLNVPKVAPLKSVLRIHQARTARSNKPAKICNSQPSPYRREHLLPQSPKDAEPSHTDGACYSHLRVIGIKT